MSCQIDIAFQTCFIAFVFVSPRDQIDANADDETDVSILLERSLLLFLFHILSHFSYFADIFAWVFTYPCRTPIYRPPAPPWLDPAETVKPPLCEALEVREKMYISHAAQIV